jgi:cell division protein FtsB
VVVTCLYVLESSLSIISARSQRDERAAQVQALEAEHAQLLSERKALAAPDGISAQARRLGMVLPGEVPYVVTGLPGDRR